MALDSFRKDWYSQNGEDGVLLEIAKRLSIEEGYAVEFGAWDGLYASNSYHLVSERNWSALHIESDVEKYEDLLRNPMVEAGRITPANRTVVRSGQDSLDNILAEYNVDSEFDLLSIDIDSIDYYVWERFTEYSPKIVVIEINSSVGPDVKRISSNGYIERIFANMVELGAKKGYTPVCHTGNIVFVRDDLMPTLKLNADDLPLDNVFNDRGSRRRTLPSFRPLQLLYRAVLKARRIAGDNYQRMIGPNPYDIYWDDDVHEMIAVIASMRDPEGSIVISTARPELLCSCAAVLVHPEDERFSDLEGRFVRIPIFGQEVPIMSSELANPNYETGVMMVSSYADSEDVDFFRDHPLKRIVAIDGNGVMTSAAGKYHGQTAVEAREAVKADLESLGALSYWKPLQPAILLSPQHEPQSSVPSGG